MDDLLANLNAQQRQAVQTVHGPVLVLAGPGSGKTGADTAYRLPDRRGRHRAVEHLGGHLYQQGGARDAAMEMIFEQKFGPSLPGQPPRLGGLAIGTFHSICARCAETEAIGYARNWVIYDSADQLALLRTLLRELNLDEKRYSPQAIRAHISKLKNEMVSPQDYQPGSYFEEIVNRTYGRYQEALQGNNAMDFDDLLVKTATLLRR